ncbi:MAG TPA: L-seryl-tRNA(Sec) selenium transferase, partial [Steroidobacteraceae bacterium]|nr:L-seryl-tRNA(Sec) selenium transferase [Steroidobacteraceae bacterium]
EAKAAKLPASAPAAGIPSVDRLLHARPFGPLLAQYGRTRVTARLRAHLQGLRRSALGGTLEPAALTDEALAAALAAGLATAAHPALRPVFNLTGTVLHTNLGRARLPEAVSAVTRALSAPVSLELDLESGERGERDTLVEPLLCELTGAQAATVVNNNAAAVLLALSVLASRREVLVSRGELIEIGGSFRLPDIMRRAGAKLVEVGTTNRTHLKDYAEALGPRASLLLKVHTSNYAISGFTASVPLAKLVKLGRARGVPVAVDLGSGSLVDLEHWQLPHEPTAREALAAGADLVTFSGDKLLGGPQAGLIVGRADLIARLRQDPLKRALRVSKLTLAALEAVLALYRAPEFLAERLTTLRLLTRAAGDMEAQAVRLAPRVQQAVGPDYDVGAAPLVSQIGSGALPVEQLASHGLAIRAAKGRRASLATLEAALRALPRPVLGRLKDKTLWLDLRCLESADEAEFWAQLAALTPASAAPRP